jgi:hypothetical protein
VLDAYLAQLAAEPVGVAPEKLSSKMANSLSQSNRLQKTYAPVQLAAVRDADASRKLGRAKLKGERARRARRR